MNPMRRPLPAEDESLQADVMRFMAIIAFCLIAIFALVRNTAPLDAPAPQAVPTEAETVVEAPVEAPMNVPMNVPMKAPAEMTQPVPDEPAVQTAQARARVPAPAEAPAESPPPALPRGPEQGVAVAPEPALAAKQSDIDKKTNTEDAAVQIDRAMQAMTEADDDLTPVAVPWAAEEAASVPEVAADAREEGLSLRFASDRDFLRLVNRRGIEVFVFREGEVLQLEPGFEFTESPAPGQVYELLPSTIPERVVESLQALRVDTDGFRWGIRMPPRLQMQISRYLRAGVSGELVIDRYGDVRHVRGV